MKIKTIRVIKAADVPADAVLACYRVANAARPRVPSTTARCAGCGAQIWVALSSPLGVRTICLQCAIEDVADAGDDPALLITELQIADAKKRQN